MAGSRPARKTNPRAASAVATGRMNPHARSNRRRNGAPGWNWSSLSWIQRGSSPSETTGLWRPPSAPAIARTSAARARPATRSRPDPSVPSRQTPTTARSQAGRRRASRHAAPSTREGGRPSASAAARRRPYGRWSVRTGRPRPNRRWSAAGISCFPVDVAGSPVALRACAFPATYAFTGAPREVPAGELATAVPGKGGLSRRSRGDGRGARPRHPRAGSRGRSGGVASRGVPAHDRSRRRGGRGRRDGGAGPAA